VACCACAVSEMARLQEDVRRLRFWRSIIAELLGTLFVVFVGCAAFTVTYDEHSLAVKVWHSHDNVRRIALWKSINWLLQLRREPDLPTSFQWMFYVIQISDSCLTEKKLFQYSIQFPARCNLPDWRLSNAVILYVVRFDVPM